MERVSVCTAFIIGCLLSSVTFATVEETPPTIGTPISYEPLSFADWNKMVYGVMNAGAASQVAGSEYSNYRASLAKKKAKMQCKLDLETDLRKTRSMLYEEHQRNTSTCNNYHLLAVGSTIVGAVAAVPTFGFTAAVGVSAGASFATAGIICQQNADGRYAELLFHNESLTREFDLRVCENIK